LHAWMMQSCLYLFLWQLQAQREPNPTDLWRPLFNCLAVRDSESPHLLPCPT
jgi:hypothetical protein